MGKSIALLRNLAKIKGAQFARFTYTAKGTGEVASVLVNLGVDFKNLYLRDILTLREMKPTLEGVEADACAELLASLEQSVEKGLGNNDAYVHGKDNTDGSTYATIPGVPGVKIHKEEGHVLLSCCFVNKTVITPGTYKKVNSSEKTLAKNRIRKSLRTSTIRSYRLDGITRAALNGDVLEFS